jgi:ketosteroid isomerase-like protein
MTNTAPVSARRNDAPAVVEDFFSALERGDMTACAMLFTDDAIVWHNYDQVEQPKAEALSALAALAPARMHFEDIVRDMDGEICIQSHTVRLSSPDGRSTTFPAIQRIRLQGGRIRRIDEYLDSAHIAAAALDVLHSVIAADQANTPPKED